MIIKNLTYKNKRSFRNVVEYVLKEADKDKPILMTRYIKSREPESIIKQFHYNEQLRNYKTRKSVLLNMDILSFHPDNAEFLTDKVLKDLTRKYVSLKCPKSQSISVIHREKTNHVHVHIVYPHLEYKTGKGIRISKSRYAEIKNELEDYQRERYPELVKSEIDHSKKRAHIKQQEQAMLHQRGEKSVKMRIIEKLKQAYSLAKSKTHFYQLVQEMDYELYERNGVVVGLRHHNKKYRFRTLGYFKHFLQELDRDVSRDKKKQLLREIRKRQEELEQKKNKSKDREQ